LLVAATIVGCGKVEDPGKLPLPDVGGDDSPIDGGPIGTPITVDPFRTNAIDKVDLLFVVDNSLSMADKQGELGKRIPELIARLTADTVDPVTGRRNTSPDVHVGVITSSLGSHGTGACDPARTNKSNDDRAHLLPRPGEGGGTGWVVTTPTAAPVLSPCPGPIEASPLTWVFDPLRDPSARYKGKDGALTLQTATSCIVQSAEQVGCGYEETWEALYHFLVDPAPYATAVAKCTFGPTTEDCTGDVVIDGVDTELLAQRAAFLRPDSFVTVVILSDENDVSLRPAGKNWIPWAYPAGSMPRGWEACDAIPDDVEPDSSALLTAKGCFSCLVDSKNPNCPKPWAKDKLNNDPDGRSLRGFHQVQRFGFNFLWGRERYVNAFKDATVPASSGKLAPNPLFSGGFRDPSLLLVTGIVGAPKGLLNGPTGAPKVLTAADWEKLTSPDLAKRDPHMVESIAPRVGVPRFAGDRTIDAVNGGDRDSPGGDELQYACIAPRAPGSSGASDCESLGVDAAKKSPLCDSSTKQSYYKAYPGLRHLRILERLGASGLAASICNESFSPIVQAIVDRVRAGLGQQCLRQVLSPDASGAVPCNVVEVMPSFDGKRCETLTGVGASTGYCTPGSEPCRRASDAAFPPVTKALAAAELKVVVTVIGTDGLPKKELVQATAEGDDVVIVGSDGRRRLVCEIRQLTEGRAPPEVAKRCVEEPTFTGASTGGFCYSTVPAVVGDACTKAGSVGTLRFLGDSVPKSGSEVFLVCRK